MKRLTELCDIIGDQCDPSASGAAVYLGLEHIDSGAFWVNRWGSPSEVRSSKTRFRKGDILYGKLRPYLDKAVLADRDGICSTDILVLRPKQDVCGAYLLALIHSEAFLSHAVLTTQGVNHPRTSWAALSVFEWDVPEKPEQEKIAAVLWKVQQAIEAEEKLIAATREMKQSAMRKLFTCGLRGEPQKETEIGLIPESWRVDQIGNCCERPEYGFTASATVEARGPKFLRITDITENGVSWATVPFCECPPEVETTKQLQHNDIVIARIGATTGKSFIVTHPPRSVFASYLIRLRVRPGLDPDYFYYFLATDAYWAQINANKCNNLKGGVNGSILASLHIPLPPVDEQREIATILQTIDRKISVHERKRATLQELFKTLLHQLMTGQIRVYNLDIDTSEIAAA